MPVNNVKRPDSLTESVQEKGNTPPSRLLLWLHGCLVQKLQLTDFEAELTNALNRADSFVRSNGAPDSASTVNTVSPEQLALAVCLNCSRARLSRTGFCGLEEHMWSQF